MPLHKINHPESLQNGKFSGELLDPGYKTQPVCKIEFFNLYTGVDIISKLHLYISPPLSSHITPTLKLLSPLKKWIKLFVLNPPEQVKQQS